MAADEGTTHGLTVERSAASLRGAVEVTLRYRGLLLRSITISSGYLHPSEDAVLAAILTSVGAIPGTIAKIETCRRSQNAEQLQ